MFGEDRQFISHPLTLSPPNSLTPSQHWRRGCPTPSQSHFKHRRDACATPGIPHPEEGSTGVESLPPPQGAQIP